MNWVPFLKPIKCKCLQLYNLAWLNSKDFYISKKKLYWQTKIYNSFKHKHKQVLRALTDIEQTIRQNISSEPLPVIFADFWLASAPGNGRKTGTVSDPDVPGSEGVEEETLCFVLNNALSCKLNIYSIKFSWERWVVKFKYANDTWYSNPCHNRTLTDCTIIIPVQ